MRTRKAKDRSRLIQAAMGQIPCDLTIGNVQFFNVITGEIYPASVDILDGFVVLVREEGQEAACLQHVAEIAHARAGQGVGAAVEPAAQNVALFAGSGREQEVLLRAILQDVGPEGAC